MYIAGGQRADGQQSDARRTPSAMASSSSSSRATTTPRFSAARSSRANATARPSVTTARSTSRRRSKLYCFGKKGNNPGLAPAPKPEKWPAPGEKKTLQIVPCEDLPQSRAKTQSFRVRALDANGFTVEDNVDPKSVKWETFIPPTALVKVDDERQLRCRRAAGGGHGERAERRAYSRPRSGELKGYFKGRILPGLPLAQDFEKYELNQDTSKPPPPAVPNTLEPPTPFAYPPLPWNAARFKFEIREKDGNKALARRSTTSCSSAAWFSSTGPT